MLRNRLRTLLIILTLGPPLVWGAWKCLEWRAEQRRWEAAVRAAYKSDSSYTDHPMPFDQWLEWRRSARYRELFGNISESHPTPDKHSWP